MEEKEKQKKKFFFLTADTDREEEIKDYLSRIQKKTGKRRARIVTDLFMEKIIELRKEDEKW